MNPVFVPIVMHLDELELLTKQRMKRVRYGEPGWHFACAKSSWCIVLRRGAINLPRGFYATWQAARRVGLEGVWMSSHARISSVIGEGYAAG